MLADLWATVQAWLALVSAWPQSALWSALMPGFIRKLLRPLSRIRRLGPYVIKFLDSRWAIRAEKLARIALGVFVVVTLISAPFVVMANRRQAGESQREQQEARSRSEREQWDQERRKLQEDNRALLGAVVKPVPPLDVPAELRAIRYEPIKTSEPHRAYRLHVTILTTTRIERTRLRIEFDAPVAGERFPFNIMGHLGPYEMPDARVVPGEATSVEVRFQEPAFVPENPLLLEVYSVTPIHVIRVSRLPYAVRGSRSD